MRSSRPARSSSDSADTGIAPAGDNHFGIAEEAGGPVATLDGRWGVRAVQEHHEVGVVHILQTRLQMRAPRDAKAARELAALTRPWRPEFTTGKNSCT